MVKTLGQLLDALPGAELRGRGDTRVTGIAYDSRRVAPGDLFVALEGQHTDGHGYVRQALAQGAAAVLHSRPLVPADLLPDRAYLRAADTRRAMGRLAAAFFDYPSDHLEVIGVTGTDGKSTTVWLLAQLLEALGQSCGFVSTVQVDTGAGARRNPLRQSTPEAPDIQGLLAEMVASGRRYAVLEATSHGLSERTARLADVRFRAAVCTNITHEHLEFHGSFPQYRSDKANLFRALGRSGPPQACGGAPFGVVNLADPSHGYLRAQSAAPVLGYLCAEPSGPSAADLGAADPAATELAAAELTAERVEADLSGSRFTLRRGEERAPARLSLPGRYNVENLLAAALTVLRLRDASLARLCALLPALQGVPGRMQPVEAGQPFRVIVDYAHTPQAFSRVLPLVAQHTPGRLLAVFGSAGERDREKRPLQGALAARHCAVVILADEDPRGEDRRQILEEIAAGCRAGEAREVLLIPDRREAIRRALALASPGDTVLLLGKGHEESILYPDGPLAWDEAAVSRELLAELGFGQ